MNHQKKIKFVAILWFLMLLLPIQVFSDALIKVDTSDFNAGSIKEGKMEYIRHTYLIKNVGKDTLVIEKVKPG